MDEDIKRLNAEAIAISKSVEKARVEIAKVIVGQEETVGKLMIALLSEGHVLLEGVPGLAKTLMIRTLAQALNTDFTRIQFTPDLLPADIIGTKIYSQKDSKFSTKKGPVFTNFILADEINRAPPKVQSALLEAMQERQVTISGDTYLLELPFFVMATQNPIETEGTYRLPEAQVDRFMLKLLIDYPTKDEEMEIIRRNTEPGSAKCGKVMTAAEILKMQGFTKSVYADDKIKAYVTSLVDASRKPKEYGLDISGMIEYGASPRASIWLIMAGKASAVMQGRGYVLPEDIRGIAHDVLRHRILVTFEAEAEGVTSDRIIDLILDKVRVP